MFKQIKYGIAILGAVLSLGTAHANSGKCTAAPGAVPGTCDVIFTMIPTAPAACVGSFAPFIYTIQNTTPVPIKINYINIQVNDSLPAGVTTIDTSVANSCTVGGLLAAGASCNIQVDINSMPPATGILNRVLQVGVNTRQVELDAPITFSVCTIGAGGGVFPGIDRLVLFAGGSGSNGLFNLNPLAVVVGDIGTSPTTNIAGFTLGVPPLGVLLGSIHPNDSVAQTFSTNLTSAVTTMTGEPCDINPAFSELSGQTITAIHSGINTVCFPGNVTITGGIGVFTLNNGGFPNVVFVINVKGGGNLTSMGLILSPPTVSLVNVQTQNVYWNVNGHITLGGVGGTLIGTFIAGGNATITDLSTLIGRVFSTGGSVTLNNSLVSTTVNPNLLPV